MIEHLAEVLRDLPAYLGGHMLLSMAAMVVGLAISLPLGVVAVRRPRLAEMLLAIAGIVQTVPSLALLALMVPLLGGRIGFLPAFLALTLYSILPILSATIVGIRGVDPSMTEAALGLGMSERQMLFRVQLPLAAPVIIAGIRTSTVLVVGTRHSRHPRRLHDPGELHLPGPGDERSRRSSSLAVCSLPCWR